MVGFGDSQTPLASNTLNFRETGCCLLTTLAKVHSGRLLKAG